MCAINVVKLITSLPAVSMVNFTQPTKCRIVESFFFLFSSRLFLFFPCWGFFFFRIFVKEHSSKNENPWTEIWSHLGKNGKEKKPRGKKSRSWRLVVTFTMCVPFNYVVNITILLLTWTKILFSNNVRWFHNKFQYAGVLKKRVA